MLFHAGGVRLIVVNAVGVPYGSVVQKETDIAGCVRSAAVVRRQHGHQIVSSSVDARLDFVEYRFISLVGDDERPDGKDEGPA